MIKNLKPKKRSKYKQGYYPIKECKKYVGKGKVIYRSNWERLFCDYCERSSLVKAWDSESIEIQYFDTKTEKYHRYYPDFLVKMKDGLTILIEVKPSSHIKKPKPPKKPDKKSDESVLKKYKKRVRRYKNSLEIYRKNMLKFNAATKYCADRGWVFRIVTENWFKKIHR